MAVFELYYPNESAPTASFLPTHTPASAGSELGIDFGALSYVLGDVLYEYDIRPTRQEFTEHFPLIIDSELSSLVTFIGAVAAGAPVKLKSPLTASAYKLVNILPFPDGKKFKLEDTGSGTFALTMQFRETA